MLVDGWRTGGGAATGYDDVGYAGRIRVVG
jgi:hypothetical protein